VSKKQPLYAKQTQFIEAENALSLYTRKPYAKSTFLSKAKNKPNSNPIKPKHSQFITAKLSEDGIKPKFGLSG
jgi:hypothetical protein